MKAEIQSEAKEKSEKLKETTDNLEYTFCNSKHTVATEDQVVPECIALEKIDCITTKIEIDEELQYHNDAGIDKDVVEETDENSLLENDLLDLGDSSPFYELNGEDTSDTDDQKVPEDIDVLSKALFNKKEVLETEIEFNADLDSFYDEYVDEEMHDDFFFQEELLTLDHPSFLSEMMRPELLDEFNE